MLINGVTDRVINPNELLVPNITIMIPLHSTMEDVSLTVLLSITDDSSSKLNVTVFENIKLGESLE